MANIEAQTENVSLAGGTDTRQPSMHERHGQIVRLVNEQGYLSITAASELFGVTPQTIRRDIKELGKAGLVQRHHGGAGPALSTENVDYSNRKVMLLQEKKMIAAMVIRNIKPRSSLFINIGTTTEEVAKALAGFDSLKVITNNLNVAKILSGNPGIEVIIAGGLVRTRDGGIVGEAAINFIRQFKVDIGIIGISGIDLDGTLLDFDYREVSAAREIIANSRKVYLVADHTKFGRNAMVRLGNIEEIDALFTDRRPPAELVELLSRSKVELHVAGGPPPKD